MKCLSCEIEINPQWAHAIEQNICPFCGKAIMDEHLKNLLSNLRDTMEQLQTYQQQLDDWMLSNHNYIKTSSPDIINYLPKEALKDLRKVQDDRDFQEKKKFTVKVQTENGVQEIQAEKIQSEEKTNEFFKRAEVARTANPNAPKGPDVSPTFTSAAEKTAHLKEMAKQIKKAGSTGINADGGSMMISAEMMENADPEAINEYHQMISGGEIASSLSDVGDDDVPAGVLAANQALAAKRGGGNASSAADLLKLQQMQDRDNKSRADFESGANRGSKGGGFSRSG
jgi:hypothetical protein